MLAAEPMRRAILNRLQVHELDGERSTCARSTAANMQVCATEATGSADASFINRSDGSRERDVVLMCRDAKVAWERIGSLSDSLRMDKLHASSQTPMDRKSCELSWADKRPDASE